MKFLSESEVSLEDFMGGDNRVAMSAWISFGNDDDEKLKDQRRVGGLINFLYKNQHMTPFESSVFTFRIKTPIFVARELFRHRSASYNEWSARYSEMAPEFYVPANTRPLTQEGKPGNYYFTPGSPEQHVVVSQATQNSYEAAWKSYQEMLGDGVAKEVARNVLPVGIFTYFYVTMNARNLMHFLNLRTAPNALYEIREVANKIESYFSQTMPLTYMAYKEAQNKLLNSKDFEVMYQEECAKNAELYKMILDMQRTENEGGK